MAFFNYKCGLQIPEFVKQTCRSLLEYILDKRKCSTFCPTRILELITNYYDFFSVRLKSLLPARATPTVRATHWWVRGSKGGRSNPKSPLSTPFRWRKLPVPLNQTHPPPQEAMPMPKTTLLPLPHPQSCKTETKRRRRSPHQRRNGKGYCRPQAGDKSCFHSLRSALCASLATLNHA